MDNGINNMSVRKITSVIIFSLLSAFYAFSEVKITAFSFAPEIGFLNGTIVENVWNANVTQSGKTLTYTPTTKMSRLDWQFENAVFFGATTELTFNDKINFNFSIKNAIAKDCGVMEDYDWLNPLNWPNDPADEITNYSKHTNTINSFTLIDFTLGRIFFLGKKKNISITPCAGFEVETIDLSGIGGWKTYKSDDWEVIPFKGNVISYSQVYAVPVIKLCSDFNFLKYFETTLNLSAVYIEILDCLDEHHLRNALFNDRIQDSWKLQAELGLYFKFLQMNKIGIKGSISYIPDSYGFTYSPPEATKPDSSTMGGTNRLLWSYSFVYVFKF